MSDIIVISHRRSGTHLTINFVINNLNKRFKFITISNAKHKIHYNKKVNYIIKTHFDYENYNIDLFNNCFKSAQENIFLESKKIFVCRNPLDTLRSMYYYIRSFSKAAQRMKIEQYIKSTGPLEKWVKFMNHFINRKEEYNLFIVSYDDIIKTPQKTIDDLSKFLGCGKKPKLMKHNNGSFNKPARPILKHRTNKTPLEKSLQIYIIDYVVKNLDNNVKEILKSVKGFEFLNEVDVSLEIKE
jgi:hypothetical protein